GSGVSPSSWRAARSTLFPDTTLFRSDEERPAAAAARVASARLVDVGHSVAEGAVRARGGALLVRADGMRERGVGQQDGGDGDDRSEEHTSELQSRENLVCRLLLETKT